MREPPRAAWEELLKDLPEEVGLFAGRGVVGEGLRGRLQLLVAHLRTRGTQVRQEGGFLRRTQPAAGLASTSVTSGGARREPSQNLIYAWSGGCTHQRLHVFLQAGVPRLLHRRDAVAEGLLAPPQDPVWQQVEAREGVPQKVLLHPFLLRQRSVSVTFHRGGSGSTDTHLWNPHGLRQRQVVGREPVVQERNPQLQPGTNGDVRQAEKSAHGVEAIRSYPWAAVVRSDRSTSNRYSSSNRRTLSAAPASGFGA